MILNASGCLDALVSPETARSLDAFVTKTVTPLPRDGNPPVRIAETDVGMLNTIGLANPGIDAFQRDALPRLTTLGVPLWVSVGGFSADEQWPGDVQAVAVAERAEDAKPLSAFDVAEGARAGPDRVDEEGEFARRCEAQ